MVWVAGFFSCGCVKIEREQLQLGGGMSVFGTAAAVAQCGDEESTCMQTATPPRQPKSTMVAAALFLIAWGLRQWLAPPIDSAPV